MAAIAFQITYLRCIKRKYLKPLYRIDFGCPAGRVEILYWRGEVLQPVVLSGTPIRAPQMLASEGITHKTALSEQLTTPKFILAYEQYADAHHLTYQARSIGGSPTDLNDSLES